MESLSGNKMIRLSKSCLSDNEKQAVMEVLNHEHLGMGSEVQQFEEALSEFFGRPVVCVVNGTAALHLALQAAGVGVDDEVLVQSLTYVASFQAISATGARPVACDVNPETLCLDWKDAEKRLTLNTKAVMPVHYSGGVGNLDEIYAFAEKHNLRVIEDAAHAFGTDYKGRKIGSFGDISCFSFDGIKNITSGEGGCIVTNDNEILKIVKDARLLGVEKDTDKRYAGERSWDFDVTSQGWRYHMSNIMAAIGIEQLKRLPKFIKKRRLLAKLYDELLDELPEIQSLDHDYDKVVPHIYVIRVVGEKYRKAIKDLLSAKAIQIGHHYQPNHWLSLYRDGSLLPCINTENISSELISLPLHPDISRSDIEYIVEQLRTVIISEE